MRQEIDWTGIRKMPRVAMWNKGKRAKTWEQVRDEYAALPKIPLLISAELATPVIHAETGRTHIDSILAFAALTAHPVASDYDTVAIIPLPLDLAWLSGEGQPLWTSSPLMPTGETHDIREYWHKRYPSHRADFGHKLNAVTSAGRWKEYRTPVHVQQAKTLHALCIGNADEVRRLLEVVMHVGKKGSMGYGRVARWHVTEVGHTRDEVLEMRAVPVEYYAGETPKGILSPLRAWTPPYWYAPWWRPCMVPHGG